MFVVTPSVELLSITPESARLIERAGRTCYKSEDREITNESAAKFIQMVLRRGHESVLEHASATFRIICDRGVSHEIVRHRLASYSQESTRYCNYGKDRFGQGITVLEPTWSSSPGTSAHTAAHAVWEAASRDAEAAYLALLAIGETPQTARSVLPTCLKTELEMTANFREWRHFIKMRLAPDAHPDIRPIAYWIWERLYAECPPVFESFKALAEEYSNAR